MRSRLKAQQISSDCFEVFVAHVGRRMHHLLAHAARGDGVAVGSGLEVIDQLVNRPAADPFALIGRDIGREPALQRRTLQIGAVPVGAHRRLRRVAGAAVTERIDKIASAVPLGRLRRIRLETPR